MFLRDHGRRSGVSGVRVVFENPDFRMLLFGGGTYSIAIRPLSQIKIKRSRHPNRKVRSRKREFWKILNHSDLDASTCRHPSQDLRRWVASKIVTGVRTLPPCF
jgi:hypothetical protein